MGNLIFENASVGDVPEEVYDVMFKESLHTDEALHVYKNDLAECGWSMTKLAIGDKVKFLDSRYSGVIVDLTPATYGMLNVHIRRDDGKDVLAYPGDLVKIEDESQAV